LPRWFWVGRIGGLGEEFVEIDGSVFGSVLEAESDLLIAEAGLRREAVDGGAAFTQSGFDLAAKVATNAIEIAGDAGFMFAESAADFGEGLLLGIVEAETIAIAGIECGES
jgi:hypothetical protein